MQVNACILFHALERLPASRLPDIVNLLQYSICFCAKQPTQRAPSLTARERVFALIARIFVNNREKTARISKACLPTCILCDTFT